MNRNVNSHFATNPTSLDMPRSKFDRNQEIKLSGNVGDIIPFYIDEILPGDTCQVKTSKVVRLQTPLTPFMDNIELDTYFFFVPNRLVWEHWKNFMGENTSSAWIPETEYTIPQITSPSGGWNAGTIADYFGVPTNVNNLSVNALPFRAYALIMNEWFRDQNNTDPLNIPINDSTQTGTNGSSYVNDVANGGMPFKAAKYHDYFTSALPSPQKGPTVQINIGDITGPVYGTGKALALTDGTKFGGTLFSSTIGLNNNTNKFGTDVGNSIEAHGSLTDNLSIGVPTKAQISALTGATTEMTGLYAEMNDTSLITINQLRQAFQIQKYYEKLARGGSRYIEIIKSMFGVTSPDARLQRPEYLGGNRVPMQVNQVIQTSKTEYSSSENDISGNPLGTTAAYSLTADVHGDFIHSFVEHGYVIGLMVARYKHTYQQGIEKTFLKKNKLDYYLPIFANLGEQAIKNAEIYAQGSSATNPSTGKAYDEEVFGYQEAWAEYRYKPNRVCGEMRSNYATSLDTWHLADDYDALPSLSDSWIREDKSNVDRVLAVTSSVSNQFFADIYVENESTRCMPIYSIPGLIDHH